MSKRWIEYVPLDELRPDPRNPRAHENVDDLRASLGRWGYAEPILVDERTGLLVAGHGRRDILLDDYAAGREPADGVDVREDGRWLVPVVRGWSSRDDDEALGYLIASNRLPEQSGWIPQLLAEGLEHLAAVAPDGAGLVGVGYAPEALSLLLAQVAPRPDPEPPTEFATIDPTTLAVQHSCPRCGYQWSGSSGAPAQT